MDTLDRYIGWIYTLDRCIGWIDTLDGYFDERMDGCI
jgi:hypothetical protein